MPRYLKFPNEHKEIDFLTKYKKENNAKLKIRYLAMHYLQTGKTASEIAALLSITIKSIGVWVNKIKSEGIDGLKNKPKSGRKPLLTQDKLTELKTDVLEMQNSRSGGRIIAKDVQAHILNKFNIKCSLSAVYNFLEAADLVWITGRSAHPKKDVKAQDEFKKNSRK